MRAWITGAVVWVLVIGAACRGDGRSPERTTVSGPTGSAASAGSGSAGSTTETPVQQADPSPEPVTTGSPPPGDDTLGAPPAELARRITLEEVAHGLHRPVLFTVAPGDARRRHFIVEQRGTIRIQERGKLLAKPFFSMQGLAKGSEQGLLGLAFHPAFATNGRLYVHYNTRDRASHIDEYRVSSTDPDVVDYTTKRELLVVEQPYSNHNGGHVEFGPDGKLYTGLGDGGAANDPHGNGQNPKTLLSKILRIDVDTPGAKPEIVHMGLRNPWRFTFDRKTNDLLIGDVGQNLWEYVFGVRGGDTRKHNFGWNVVEGTHCFDPDTGRGKKSCDKTGFTPPLVEYSHDEGCSITGGVVYRGTALPALDGRYFYADYCTGLLRSFVWKAGFVREHWDWKPAIDKQGVLSNISSFGVDHDGELYIALLTGSIYKLVPAP